ncbi:ARM repeat-containing protein, partial [Gonapodya prolifera JEL478]
KKIQGLLNKLTMDNFDAISLQILGMPVTGPDQLEIVVEKIFDKAVDEPNFAALYSKLCAKLTKELPEKQPWIIGDDKHNAFRRFILNKNQKEYEAGNKWSEMGKNRVKKDVSEMTQEEKDTIIAEEELKAKLKRRTLGNVVFIGELFKLGLLTEKIMHTCILGLLRDVHDALKSASGNKITVEEELETLIKLLTTAGQKLDHQKAADHIDSYFKEMSNLSKNELITSRIRFGLLDLIDLRRNKWVSRRQVTGPKTIAEIRAEVSRKR